MVRKYCSAWILNIQQHQWSCSLVELSHSKSADVPHITAPSGVFVEWCECKEAFNDKSVDGRVFPPMKMYLNLDTPGKCNLR